MKNKIISIFVGVALFASIGISTANAQTFNSGDFLASISQIINSLSQILTEALNAVSNEPKTKDIIQTIQVQTETLKAVIEENRNIISQKILNRTIGLGAVGEDVKIVQKYLASQPDVYPEGLVTGYYGTLTQKAVQEFQQKNSLDPVGVVGPKTLDIINQELTESAANVTVPPEFNLQGYTVALLNIINDLKQAPIARKNVILARLTDYASLRKTVVLETMKTNPRAVLENAVPAWAISQMPSGILDSVEQRRKVSGKFEWIHIHYGDFGTGKVDDEFYVIENGTNKRYKINIEEEPRVLTDDTVTVEGVVLDDQIATMENLINVVSSANKKEISADRSLFQKVADIFSLPIAEAQTSTTTPKKVAVIMFNWQDDMQTPWTTDQVRGAYFTNSNSANAYYKEVSFNKIELTGKSGADGDIFGWVTVPYSEIGCPYLSAANAADSILQASGVDLSGYNMKSYVFPSAPCGWSGQATVGGIPARSYINGSIGSWVLYHELGHNLGTHHASSLSCTESGVRVSIGQDSNCVLDEYGDPYSVMGSAANYHMHNYNKGIGLYSMNWLEPQNTLTIDQSIAPDATYAIAPIEWTTASGVQSLRIPRELSATGSPIDYYYLESRQPFGFDNFTSTSLVANGVTIRIAPNYTATMKSKLIDTTPGTPSFLDAPLAVGKTFTDPYKSINITNLSISPAGAQVRVSFGPLPCIRANPSFSISPASASLYAGQSASFSYTITNNDTSACPSSDFSITSTLPVGFFQSPSSITYTLSAGASASGTFIITTALDAAVSTYSITESVINTSEPAYQSVVSLGVTILPADTTPPSVAITLPSDGAVISGKANISISVSASDASGIAEIKILFDGSLLKTCYNVTSCSAKKSAKSIPSGTHIISAQATDNGGPVANTASASIAIIKR